MLCPYLTRPAAIRISKEVSIIFQTQRARIWYWSIGGQERMSTAMSYAGYSNVQIRNEFKFKKRTCKTFAYNINGFQLLHRPFRWKNQSTKRQCNKIAVIWTKYLVDTKINSFVLLPWNKIKNGFVGVHSKLERIPCPFFAISARRAEMTTGTTATRSPSLTSSSLTGPWGTPYASDSCRCLRRPLAQKTPRRTA